MVIIKKNTCEIFDKFYVDDPYMTVCKNSISQAFEVIKGCYENNGKLMVCGNGGSAADSEHIVGELMKGFLLKRKITKEDNERIFKVFPKDAPYLANNLQRALPALSLVSQISLSTAYINDIAPDMVYAQQVYGYANSGDVLVGISTSGNAANVVNAAKTAKVFNVRTIGMTGEMRCLLDEICDVVIKVPSGITYKVQEMHMSVYHTLCAALEEEFFGY